MEKKKGAKPRQNYTDYSKVKKKRRRKTKTTVFVARFLFVSIILLFLVLIGIGVHKIITVIGENVVSDDEVTTVTVTRKGEIRQTIIEEFDPSVYDEESLEADIKQRIRDSGGKVESEGLDFSDGVATLKLKYKDDDAMAAFNDEVFYADTMDNLTSQGVSFESGAVKSGGSRAVIVSESMDIRCPKKIVYTGGDVVIDEDDQKLAHCTTAEGNIAFVIY